ncbi:MAG: hypothetical protein VX063_07430 [SAR324 cluster bacterium]|nr:hypothetical protein [SAR324 cluster bacterium]
MFQKTGVGSEKSSLLEEETLRIQKNLKRMLNQGKQVLMENTTEGSALGKIMLKRQGTLRIKS